MGVDARRCGHMRPAVLVLTLLAASAPAGSTALAAEDVSMTAARAVARMAELDDSMWLLDESLRDVEVRVPAAALDDREALRATLREQDIEVIDQPVRDRLVPCGVRMRNVFGLLGQLEMIHLGPEDPAPDRNVYCQKLITLRASSGELQRVQAAVRQRMIEDPRRAGQVAFVPATSTVVVTDLASAMAGHLRLLEPLRSRTPGAGHGAPGARGEVHPALARRHRAAPATFAPEIPEAQRASQLPIDRLLARLGELTGRSWIKDKALRGRLVLTPVAALDHAEDLRQVLRFHGVEVIDTRAGGQWILEAWATRDVSQRAGALAPLWLGAEDLASAPDARSRAVIDLAGVTRGLTRDAVLAVRVAMTRDGRRAGNVVQLGQNRLVIEDLGPATARHADLVQALWPAGEDTRGAHVVEPPRRVALERGSSASPAPLRSDFEDPRVELTTARAIARMAELIDASWSEDAALRGKRIRVPRPLLDDAFGIQAVLEASGVAVIAIPEGDRLWLHGALHRNAGQVVADLMPVVLTAGDPIPAVDVYLEMTVDLDAPAERVATLRKAMRALAIPDPTRTSSFDHEPGTRSLRIRGLASRFPAHLDVLRAAGFGIPASGRTLAELHPALAERERSSPPPFQPDLPRPR